MQLNSSKRVAFLVLGALAALTLGYATLIEPRYPRLRKITIPLPKLNVGLKDLSILHISDLHMKGREGATVRFVEGLASLYPDIVVLTGDMIGHEAAIEACASLMGKLRARYGIYAVLGNHEHSSYPFWSAILGTFKYRIPIDTQAINVALRGQGIKVLNNESSRIEVGDETIHLVGVDDMFSHADNLAEAMAGVERGGMKILLCHSPDILDEAVAAGFDLVLSGHTHGGQVRLPLVGALTTHTRKPLRPASGILHRGQTVMHVSQGLGTSGLPIRFLCPPEATLLQLQQA
ncbi:MAG: metallophosphoesterase [Dehalococcoidia bacterium]